MPDIKGVKHKVDTKGIDLKKIVTEQRRQQHQAIIKIHQGLPYNQMQIRPKVESWVYNVRIYFKKVYKSDPATLRC